MFHGRAVSFRGKGFAQKQSGSFPAGRQGGHGAGTGRERGAGTPHRATGALRDALRAVLAVVRRPCRGRNPDPSAGRAGVGSPPDPGAGGRFPARIGAEGGGSRRSGQGDGAAPGRISVSVGLPNPPAGRVGSIRPPIPALRTIRARTGGKGGWAGGSAVGGRRGGRFVGRAPCPGRAPPPGVGGKFGVPPRARRGSPRLTPALEDGLWARRVEGVVSPLVVLGLRCLRVELGCGSSPRSWEWLWRRSWRVGFTGPFLLVLGLRGASCGRTRCQWPLKAAWEAVTFQKQRRRLPVDGLRAHYTNGSPLTREPTATLVARERDGGDSRCA